MLIRSFGQADAAAVVELVRSVFEEYGFVWDLDGYCADLADPLAHYDKFWVADDGYSVVACVGLCHHELLPGEPGTVTELDGEVRVAATDCELVRLYAASAARGQGLGARLTETVMDSARSHGRRAVEVWSDKRLFHAHALYERLGAVKVGERICPEDPDMSPEWGFRIGL